MSKPVVRLDNARIIPCPRFFVNCGSEQHVHLAGNVHGHPHQPFDGAEVTTTQVVREHDEGEYETRNTVYVVESWR